ncbi:hypothetical protein OG245_29380 [Streptomyces sp. NBC_01116]|uniref:hypothetical protein n=1 Tax=Streptomyces sp. NBC_01116 TaxID=2903752 RepID=UPI0032430428
MRDRTFVLRGEIVVLDEQEKSRLRSPPHHVAVILLMEKGPQGIGSHKSMRDISNGYTGHSSADRTRILARALPPLLVVLGIAWQAVTPQEITGTPFFTAAPLVAAPLFARWVAAFFGAVGILAAVLLHVVGGKVTQDAAAQYLTTELATIAFATVFAVLIHGVVERARNQAATARGVAE